MLLSLIQVRVKPRRLCGIENSRADVEDKAGQVGFAAHRLGIVQYHDICLGTVDLNFLGLERLEYAVET